MSHYTGLAPGSAGAPSQPARAPIDDAARPIDAGAQGGTRYSLGGMSFLAALLIDGALAGALYALIALSFVVVYRASRMINFAVGECVMLASRLVALGVHGLGLGVAGGLAVGGAGMVAVMVAFNEAVLRRLAGRPVIALIMITIGLANLLRGAAALLLGGVPPAILGPTPEPLLLGGVPVAIDKLVAAAIAVLGIVTVAWTLQRSRTGVALRAIADDQQSAMAVGIDLHRYFGLTWALVGVISVVAGTLWTVVAGGGFGMALVGLKVFPIVIIGGLDSIVGTIVGAVLVGVLESLAAGYIDPLVGGGFSNIASYLVLLAVLFVRPHGLFGRPDVRRI
jgi:branched-chain amino acid transport system permease protein